MHCMRGDICVIGVVHLGEPTVVGTAGKVDDLVGVELLGQSVIGELCGHSKIIVTDKQESAVGDFDGANYLAERTFNDSVPGDVDAPYFFEISLI